MKVWDIGRIICKDRKEYGSCFKIKQIIESWDTPLQYISEGWGKYWAAWVEPSRKTEFEEDMVVKLNERWMEAWSTKAWYQLPKDSRARVIELCQTDIKIERIWLDGNIVSNHYKKHHLDILHKPVTSTSFKVWDKIRVNKPAVNKAPNRVGNMDQYDKDILTIKEIIDNGYILVEENSRAFHPDRCTPIDTKTSGLEPHLKPEPKFKVGDIVRLINDDYKYDDARPKGYTFTVAEISDSITNKRYRYRETVWKINWVEEWCLELADVQQSKGRWLITTMYIDEAMAQKHRDLMDDYIHKQTVDLQGRQHQYLLSLSKTKPMTDTLKELRFEDYTKKNLKDIVASSEMLDDTLQKLCILRRRISGFESFVDRTLVSLDRAYENHDKEAIADLLKQANTISKVVNSDLYKATVTGLEWLEKLDKHFEA